MAGSVKKLLSVLLGWLFILLGASPVSAEVPPPVTVQQWHTGLWISWDRSAGIKSLLVSAAAEDMMGDPKITVMRFAMNDFGYYPLGPVVNSPRSGSSFKQNSAPPYRRTLLISIIPMDFTLDGVSEIPNCHALSTWPAYTSRFPKGARLTSPVECLSETLYRVTVDINNESTKPKQYPGVFFGYRERNALAKPSSCSNGCDPREGILVSSDFRRRPEPVTNNILFFDSLFSGLPLYTNVNLEYQAKSGKWFPLVGQELLTRYSYFSAMSIPQLQAENSKYRFHAYFKSRKKYVLTSPVIDISSALSSTTQASPAPVVAPISFLVLDH